MDPLRLLRTIEDDEEIKVEESESEEEEVTIHKSFHNLVGVCDRKTSIPIDSSVVLLKGVGIQDVPFIWLATCLSLFVCFVLAAVSLRHHSFGHI